MALATLRTYLRSAANDSMPVQEFPPGNSTVSLEYMAPRLSREPCSGTNRPRSLMRSVGIGVARAAAAVPIRSAVRRAARQEGVDRREGCGDFAIPSDGRYRTKEAVRCGRPCAVDARFALAGEGCACPGRLLLGPGRTESTKPSAVDDSTLTRKA
mgnify:CR=1 FL=1